MPGIPYTTNKRGFGPAWTNSLFENNAELELGLYLSVQQQREAQKMRVERLAAMLKTDDGETLAASNVFDACSNWLDAYNNTDASRKATDVLVAALESILKEAGTNAGEAEEDMPSVSAPAEGITGLAAEILKYRDQLAKKSFWMFGGDGWAYDIGFGGLDHVIAQGENINVLVIDTEVYSNTGGQSSKATPIGAVAQFASSGKKSRKKDLGAIMMTYGNVYVAQVAMGADMNQLIRVLKEAEEYDGPSVVIAYCPCVSHGIKGGMSKV